MPVKVEKKGDKFCVVEPDGTEVKCHPTEVKAAAHARAINANTEKDEKAIMVPFGVTSFEELEEAQEAAEISDKVGELTWNFQDLLWNVIHDSGESDKPSAIRKLAGDFVDRLEVMTHRDPTKELPDSHYLFVDESGQKHLPFKDVNGKLLVSQLRDGIKRIDEIDAISEDKAQELKEMAANILLAAGDKGLIEKTVDAVRKVMGRPDGRSPDAHRKSVWVWKDSGGTWRWVGRYSNKYRDEDNPPEIIASESHVKFVKLVDAGFVAPPKIWIWHEPYMEFGQSEWVAYDDSGFAIAGGGIYPGYEDLAKEISHMDDVRMSHGMPKWSIERDPDDFTIITGHITDEVSLLPGWAAANKRTSFVIRDDKSSRKEETMAISDEKKAQMVAWGVSPETISSLEALNSKDAAEAEEAGVDNKDVSESEAPVDSAPEPEEKEQTEETPSATVNLEAGIGTEAFEQAISAMINISERLKELEAIVKGLQQSDSEKVAQKVAETPRSGIDSLMGVLRTSVIGSEEAKLDGRTALGKSGPQETEPKPEQVTGIGLIDQWMQPNNRGS
jgi:hypothetical protein